MSYWMRIGLGIAGVAQLGAGIAYTATAGDEDTATTLQGAVLISTGLDGLMHALNYPHNNLSNREYFWEYFKETVYAVPAGIVCGVIGTYSKGASFAARLGSQICGGAISAPLSEISHSLKTGKIRSGKKLVVKVIAGSIRGFAGGSMGALTGRILFPTINVSAHLQADVMDIIYRALQGGIEGIIICATSQIASNKVKAVVQGKNLVLTKGVVASSVIGGCLGASMAAVTQWNYNKQKQENHQKLEKQREEYEKYREEHEKYKIYQLQQKEQEEKGQQSFGILERIRCLFFPHHCLPFEDTQAAQGHDKFLVPKPNKPVFPNNGEPSRLELPENTAGRAALIQAAYSEKIKAFLQPYPKATHAAYHATLVQAFNVEKITRALQPDPVVTFSSCDSDELFKHVVLVQAINDDQYFHGTGNPAFQGKFGLTDAFPWGEIDQPKHRAFRSKFALLGILSPKGEIGHHLKFEQIQFGNSKISRPTVHWSWNQLVQPNNGGNWENAQIAILQPFDDFERSENGKPFNLAPYDTFNIGVQTLGNRAIVLIPDTLANELFDLRQHYQASSIKFVTYDARQKLRDVIMDHLEGDPNVWQMCDEKGKLLGRNAKMTAGGYAKTTCIKTSDGMIIRLLQGQNTQIGNSLNVKGRTVDLHDNQTHTFFRCDEEGNKYFKALNCFKADTKSIAQNPFFAGNIGGQDRQSLKQMGSLTMLECYHGLKEHDPATNCHNLADYLIGEAIYADIVSLFFKNYPGKELTFSKFDYKLIIEAKLPYLINCLQNISDGNLKDEEVLDLFKSYTSLLNLAMEECELAKAKAKSIIEERATKELRRIPAYINIGSDEWRQINLPKELAFHLDKQWPLSEELYAYVNKILRVLPKNVEELQALYQCLATSEEINKENYRKHVIRGLIFGLIQEHCFAAESSILIHRTSSYGDELFADYGLVCSDNSDAKKIGNCLFDNIAVQIDQIHNSEQLRSNLILFMREKRADIQQEKDQVAGYLRMGNDGTEYYYDSWETYLEQMSWTNTWATETEIFALAMMLNRPILLMDKMSPPKFFNEESNNGLLLLYRKKGDHFESLFPIKGLSSQEVVKIIKLAEPTQLISADSPDHPEMDREKYLNTQPFAI